VRNCVLALLMLTSAALPAAAQTPQPPSGPARNPYLASDKYSITSFDPARTAAMPYPAPRGMFRGEIRRMPRIAGGPVTYMQLASTSPRYMWGTFTGGVRYIDVADGNFSTVARLATPGAKWLEPNTLDKALAQRFDSVDQVEAAVVRDLKIDPNRLSTNVHMLVDKDNVLYATAPGGKVHAYGLIDPKKPAAGIAVLRTLDFSRELKRIATSTSEAMQHFGASIVGLGATYDGKLVVLTNRSLTVMERSFQGDRHTVDLGEDEYVSNPLAIDEKGGIYVVSDTTLRKIVWNGSKLSAEEADGAWAALYDIGREPPNGKLGRGSGSAPTLMGFGGFPDKLVVITDGADRMKVVAFWRDEIPADFQQRPGTKSRRVAGQIEVTCGLSPAPEFIQSDQSLVVNGYGAFVTNSVRAEGATDKLVDALAVGQVFAPPTGVERVEWDSRARQWHSVWARGDASSTNGAPSMSAASDIVFVNAYTSQDGWEVTGLDWNTGATVHRTIFGHDNLGNSAYAPIQFLPNGDMLFNSIGGPTRVKFGRTKMSEKTN
jgi:hypothetical protein